MRRASDLQRANAVKARLPRCGAKCRDGSRCNNPGTGAGGKCPKHGGLTPSGDNWHCVRWPKNEARYQRKVAALARRRAKRAAEIAAMNPERRAKYEAWHTATRKPGSKSARVRAKQNREAREILERAKTARTAPDPEIEALKAELDAVRARRAALEAELARLDAGEPTDQFPTGGVFE